MLIECEPGALVMGRKKRKWMAKQMSVFWNVTWRMGMGINEGEVTNTQELELQVLICSRDKPKIEEEGQVR